MAGLGASDCEHPSGGMLAQPVNAVTGLGLVAAGGWIIARSLRRSQRRAGTLAFGASVVAAGTGSVLYHGPQPSYAKAVHDLSIVAVLSQVAVYELAHRRRGAVPEPRAYATALASIGLGAAAYALGRTSSPLCDPGSVLQLHGAWHLLAGLSLAAYARARLESPTR
ncbi:MAG: hypothetical protein ACRDJL_01305 [Actinomycetota bacterium]